MTTLQYLEVLIEPSIYAMQGAQSYRTLRIKVKTQDGKLRTLERVMDVSDVESVFDYIWRACGAEIKHHLQDAEAPS